MLPVNIGYQQIGDQARSGGYNSLREVTCPGLVLLEKRRHEERVAIVTDVKPERASHVPAIWCQDWQARISGVV